MAIRISAERNAQYTKSSLNRLEEPGDETAMLGVLFGQGEVLIIVIITAIVVFLLVRGRKR